MYFNDDTIVFLDGKFIKASEAQASLYNQTMHYGTGVFEGIRSYSTDMGGRIFKPMAHYDRFLYSGSKIHMDIPYTSKELITYTYQLLEKNKLEDAYIRPLAFGGPSMSLLPSDEVHVFIAAWEWGAYLGDKLSRVMVSGYQRPNPKACHIEAKISGHYVNSILASTEAKKKGFDEALLLDKNGDVAEGSGANIFYEKDGKLYTPPQGSILPGITRQVIIELAAELEYPVEERFFNVEELKTADAAFFTGTAVEVAGIQSVDDYEFPLSWEESIGYQLLRVYQKFVRKSRNAHFALM